jgi:hypothetical protein
MDMRGQPTTVVAVRPTAFDVHIWVGNASVRPPQSVWVGPLKTLLPIYLSARTVSDSGWSFGSFGSVRWKKKGLLALRSHVLKLSGPNHGIISAFLTSCACTWSAEITFILLETTETSVFYSEADLSSGCKNPILILSGKKLINHNKRKAEAKTRVKEWPDDVM